MCWAKHRSADGSVRFSIRNRFLRYRMSLRYLLIYYNISRYRFSSGLGMIYPYPVSLKLQVLMVSVLAGKW
jgi:hypothetical protein